jgi:hypothetical protein
VSADPVKVLDLVTRLAEIETALEGIQKALVALQPPHSPYVVTTGTALTYTTGVRP